jgi:hypothetical protein
MLPKEGLSSSQSGAARHAAGEGHEEHMALDIAWLRRRGHGYLEKHHVPTKVVKRPGRKPGTMEAVRVSTGDASVDYTGHVSQWDGGPTASVYLDLKGVTGRSSYKHEPDAMHQLDLLDDVARMGAWAFLLLVDPTAGYAWVVHRREEFAALRHGTLLRICERTGPEKRPHVHHLPHVPITASPLGDRAPWVHWLPLVRELFHRLHAPGNRTRP